VRNDANDRTLVCHGALLLFSKPARESTLRPMYDDDREVRPDGLTVRRLRHERGWSPRALISEIERVRFAATGLRETLTPYQLGGIEEHDEAVPYSTLCLISDAFDCDPIHLVRENQEDDEPDQDGDTDGRS